MRPAHVAAPQVRASADFPYIDLMRLALGTEFKNYAWPLDVQCRRRPEAGHKPVRPKYMASGSSPAPSGFLSDPKTFRDATHMIDYFNDGTSSQPGRMFWFTRNRFVGSNLLFNDTRRGKLSPKVDSSRS